MFGRDLGLIVAIFGSGSVFGLFAWWQELRRGTITVRGMVASVFVAITVYAVTFPFLPSLF